MNFCISYKKDFWTNFNNFDKLLLFISFYLDHGLINNIHSIVAMSILFIYPNWPNPIIITPNVPNFQIVYPQTISWSYIPIIIVSKHCNIISANILLYMRVYGILVHPIHDSK